MMIILKENNREAAEIAAQILKNNGIICFATETVYAIACNAASDLAVAKLYKIKKRSFKKPIAVFIKNLAMAKKIFHFSKTEENIAQEFMPGMITLILQQKSNKQVSPLLNNNDKNLGLRIPNHQFCLKLLSQFNGAIAATSANFSNEEAAISFEQALQYFKNKVDLIIDGGICANKIASTVLKIEDDKIKIIREGLITKNQLIEICKN